MVSARIRLPKAHDAQRIFLNWQDEYPEAQCLVAPAGTKTGKTFGSSIWMIKEALIDNGLYCAWIAPTYLKARIGYRYVKAMLPDSDFFRPIDGRLEIVLANGSFIKFLHGRDAEVTVEGEAIDRFVIDEAGKIQKQVWFSLFTTITQTRGYGIVTGTPRGFGWYYDVWRKGMDGDKFFHSIRLATSTSPYIEPEAIANARRLLPRHLYEQYYLANFVTNGSVFGELSTMWDETLKVPDGNPKFWIHPDENERNTLVVHGMDIAKQRDYTVVYSVNDRGKLVGYCRYRHVPYPQQATRLKAYIVRYFNGEDVDNFLNYDATGVGQAFGDIILEELDDIDISINPVVFTNKSKSEMVTRMTLAIEQGWHKAPRIQTIEHEFGTYEVSITKTGLHSYSAPDGEHDDVVSAAMIAISTAYKTSLAHDAEKMLEQSNSNTIENYATAITEAEDDFFNDQGQDDDWDQYLED